MCGGTLLPPIPPEGPCCGGWGAPLLVRCCTAAGSTPWWLGPNSWLPWVPGGATAFGWGCIPPETELVLAPGGRAAPGGGPLLSSPQWSRSKSIPPQAGRSSLEKIMIKLISRKYFTDICETKFLPFSHLEIAFCAKLRILLLLIFHVKSILGTYICIWKPISKTLPFW